MGRFLERLRWDAEKRERIERETRERDQEELRRQIKDYARRYDPAVLQEREERNRRANDYFRQSGMKDLVVEFARAVGFGFKFPVFEPGSRDLKIIRYLPEQIPELELGICLTVGGKTTFNGVVRKVIFVMCSPDGTIRVEGGLFGSTNVPIDKWQGNRDLLERALERAYRHPRTVADSDPTSSSGAGSGVGPGI